MNENELLESFLKLFPETLHPCDRERFLKYAIACTRNDHNLDLDALRNRGVSDERIKEYQIAFEWIKDTCNFLR